MAYIRKEYVQSDAVTQAQQALQNHQAGKPGQYQSSYQSQLDSLLGQINARPRFSYDLNADGLYRQYRDQYIRQGRRAMADTMGKAAALTGGYGNSYAQTAGQQAYGEYLQSLNDRIPELYSLALERYRLEGDQLESRYGLLRQQEQADYDRYRDAVADWDSQNQRLYQQFLQERSYDYGIYSDEQDFAYDAHRDLVADEKWQAAYDYQKQQDQLAYEQWQQEFAYQKEQDQLAYQQWLQEFQENQRRYNQSQSKSVSRGSSGSKKQETSQDTLKAQTFVENMLGSATGSRFDPERVINATNALTQSQKQEAQKYLQTVLNAGRMK